MVDDVMLCDVGDCGHEVTFFRRYYHEGALMRDEVCADHVRTAPANEEVEVYALVPIDVTGPRLRARETARWMCTWLMACAKFACPTEAHFRLLAWSHLGLPAETIDAIVREVGGGDGDGALAGLIPRAPSPWDADLLARSRDLLLTDPTTAAQLRAVVAAGVGDQANYRRVLRETLVQQVAAMDTTLGKMRSLLEGLDLYFPTLPGRPLPTETFARLFVAVRDSRSSSSATLSLLARALREWVAFLPMHPNVYEAWLLSEAKRDWPDTEEGKKAADKLRRAAAQRVPTETAFRVVLTDCPWMSEEDIGIALASVSAQKGHGQKTLHDPLGAERRAWNEREQVLLRDLRQARETIRTLQGKIEEFTSAKGLTTEQTEQVAAAVYNGLAHAGVDPNEGAGPAWDKVLKSLQDLSDRDHVDLSHLVRDAILASQVNKPGVPEASPFAVYRARADEAILAGLQRVHLEGSEALAAWRALLDRLYAPTPTVTHDLVNDVERMLRAVQAEDRAAIVEKLSWHPAVAQLRMSDAQLDQVVTVITGKSLIQRVEEGILRQLSEPTEKPGEYEDAIYGRLNHDYTVLTTTLTSLVESERVLRREDDGSYVLPPSVDRVRAAIVRACEAKPEPWLSIEDLRALVQVALGVPLSDRAFDRAYLPMWKAGTVREHRIGLSVFVGLPSRTDKAPKPSVALEQRFSRGLDAIEARVMTLIEQAGAPLSYTHLVAARQPGTTRALLDTALGTLLAAGSIVRIPAGEQGATETYYALAPRKATEPAPAPSPVADAPAPAAPTASAASLAEGAYVPSRDRSPAGPAREGEEVSVAALADGEFIARVKLTYEGATQPLTAWLGAGTDLVLTWGGRSVATGRWDPETATVAEWFPDLADSPLAPLIPWSAEVGAKVNALLVALMAHRPPRRWNEERAKGLLLVEAGRAMAQGSPRQAAAWQQAIANDESWQSEAGFSACFHRLGPTVTSLPDALKIVYAP